MERNGAVYLSSKVIFFTKLAKRPKISLNDLFQLLNIDTSTISSQVNQLVELELIHRHPDLRDRRYDTLSLTDKERASIRILRS
ncbi:MarR family winged helix-turn-helix transcriptional regulator [Paenibacillus elgii]